MDASHGQAATQNPRGLRRLPRQHPSREAYRVNGIVTGEPGDRKRSRRVREGGVGKGPARAPRRRRTSASSQAQLERNVESTERQYALVQRAIELGFVREQVLVIDEDLGISGSGLSDRSGFARLAAEVALGHAGLVLGSRSRGWRATTSTGTGCSICAA